MFDWPTEVSTLGTPLTKEDMMAAKKALYPRTIGAWHTINPGWYTLNLTQGLRLILHCNATTWTVTDGEPGYYNVCPATKSAEFAQRKALKDMKRKYLGESMYYASMADKLDKILEKGNVKKDKH